MVCVNVDSKLKKQCLQLKWDFAFTSYSVDPLYFLHDIFMDPPLDQLVWVFFACKLVADLPSQDSIRKISPVIQRKKRVECGLKVTESCGER